MTCPALVLKDLFPGLMDGWKDGRIDGWMDRLMAGRMDEWMDEQTYVCVCVFMYVCMYIYVSMYVCMERMKLKSEIKTNKK